MLRTCWRRRVLPAACLPASVVASRSSATAAAAAAASRGCCSWAASKQLHTYDALLRARHPFSEQQNLLLQQLQQQQRFCLKLSSLRYNSSNNSSNKNSSNSSNNSSNNSSTNSSNNSSNKSSSNCSNNCNNNSSNKSSNNSSNDNLSSSDSSNTSIDSSNGSSNSSSNCSSSSSKVSPLDGTMEKGSSHHHSSHPKTAKPHGILNFTKWGLSEWSNFAAVLCALDCTLLPLLTAAIPFAGLVADAHHLEAVHTASKWVAMYIVLPLGGFAVIANFLQLRRKRLLLMGLAGLLLVYSAHSWGGHHHHALSEQQQQQQQQVDADLKKKQQHLPTTPTKAQQQQQELQAVGEEQEWRAALLQMAELHHTLISLCGAVLLLGSNFLSHRLKHKLGCHHHAHCCSSSTSTSSSCSSSRKEKQQMEMCRDDNDSDENSEDRVSLLRDS
ncbi:hypothetical protein Efla_001587 [Eimeria flavescens]